VSYPEDYQPYVLPDGTLGNGAPALHDAYFSLRKALPQILYYATTTRLKVFMSQLPGQAFSESADVNGIGVKVSGSNDGQAIVIHPAEHEFLLVGFRCGVSFHDPAFEWPAMKKIRVHRVAWNGDHWSQEGAPSYNVNQSDHSLSVDLDVPQAVLVSW
jgi:hypothetical protein